MPERYDVIVVGAGPAGSSTAAHLCRMQPGLSVAIVDKREFPRDKACGDGIGPRAVSELGCLGVDVSRFAGSRRISSATVHGPDGLSFGTDIQGSLSAGSHGLTVRRTEFDDALLSHAVNAGAHFRGNLRFERLGGGII